MKNTTVSAGKPAFLKTEVPCLYRYSSNGIYYALVKHEGKQKRASLKTADKATAKRKLADYQRDLKKVDASSGRLTLRELFERYLLTAQISPQPHGGVLIRYPPAFSNATIAQAAGWITHACAKPGMTFFHG